MKRRVVPAVLLLAALASGFADSGEEEQGEEKIQKTIEAIQQAAEEEEEQEYYPDDEDEGSPLLELLFRIFAEIFWEYGCSLRFADYPYALSAPYVYSTSAFLDPWETKIVSAHAATDLASHLDGTFGNINRVTVALTAFHLNLYNQNIFAGSEAIRVLSANGGFSLIARGFVLNGFLGVYKISALSSCQLSFGLSAQLFLPPHLYLDLYNLNAVQNAARFNHLTASLNWSLRRFSVGLGYDCTYLAGFTYCGPCLRASFWL